MTVERYIRVFAGSFILLSLLLGAPASPLYVSSWFLWFTAFVGANLLQFGFSNFCPMGLILRRLGVRDAAPCGR
ncbi:MAG: DUF2892 domain-containing protein [Betaproteobacteria bacterium]|nr:DUF2892 domain-containing protein [Betaproteobacteria bacterium]